MLSHNDASLKIVFFDGDCGLCHVVVGNLLRLDKKKQLKFASLKGETAKSYLNHQDLSHPTVIYMCDGKVFKKSDAVLKLLTDFKGVYVGFALLFLMPRKFRDFLYDVVARNRYRFFKGECSLHKLEQNVQFLP